jgi:hypothetical protein
MGIVRTIYQSYHEESDDIEVRNAEKGIYISFDTDGCQEFILLDPEEARELAALILTTANQWENENT